MNSAKEEFLARFGREYGYPDAHKNIDEIRATEFKRLQGLVYLDHAGATLYSESQIEAVAQDLTSNLFGNPHSQSDCSLASSNMIAAARQQVLGYLNASPKEYTCIFTSGATAAFKLVGESFPWSRESCYMYTMENHNSVLGIREYALEQGATALAVDVKQAEHQSSGIISQESQYQFLTHSTQRRAENEIQATNLNNCPYNLFAFPSECNFTGGKFHLDLVKVIKKDAGSVFGGSLNCQRGRWLVLIDAAKGCATEPPDLARYPADFVVFSFYKIFGYPTGLGALVVRTDAAKLLRKTYFSGGTVSASIADIDFVKRRESIEQLLEDGTVSFLSIASIRHGFKMINTLTLSAISRHTACLATYVRNAMLDLKHENGVNVCILYGTKMTEAPFHEMGPTIAFNLKRADGSWFGYREVEKLASLSGIQLRTGCFCNPGACAKYVGLTHADLLSNLKAGHVCWDDNDVIHGKPTGAIRISFGYMSTFEDAEAFLRFIVDSFVMAPKVLENGYPLAQPFTFSETGGRELLKSVRLKSITIYPVKSCAGFSTDSWPLCNTGLLYDRQWLLKGPNGEVLTQKKVPEMCHIKTFIDLEQKRLYLESPRCKEKLQISVSENLKFGANEEMDVYGQRYEVQEYDGEINAWFNKAITHPCTLVRCSNSKYPFCTRKGEKDGICRDLLSKLNFANEAQFLLISEDSVSELSSRLRKNLQNVDAGGQGAVLVDSMRFRPNLVISGAEPYAEDGWTNISIGKANFVSLGGCNRCHMINLNQQNGTKSREPLATLASYRRVQGKILFGILLSYQDTQSDVGNTERWLQVAQQVFPTTSSST